MRLGIATALLSMGLMGCRNTIVGSWKAYSWNKYELPMSLCEEIVSRHPRLYTRSR